MFYTKLSGIALALFAVAGCSGAPGEAPAGEEEAVSTQKEAMSRCGYPPRRPWPSGCVFRCECSEPVNGPFGEDIDDYECIGNRCRLRPRPDCAFEATCE